MGSTDTYDYVIVGAGSAGCVLADRLSSNPANRVLLLEAGGSDNHPLIRMPAGVAKVATDTRFNWDYYTEPQRHLNNRRLYWPRGRVLGGSSSINAMCYVRGQRSDYDQWVQDGAHGWSYDDVLPIFKRSENYFAGGNRYHGDNGPLQVQKLRHHNPLTDIFLHAAQQAGYIQNDDFNGASQEGIGHYHVTQNNGARCSSAVAFLHPAQRRANLTVKSQHTVDRVLFDGSRAIGVEARSEGRPQTFFAAETVLCGGAVNTPQLLMLSGIGPADHLRGFGIDVQHDSPNVGQNLQDHLDVCTLYKCTKPITYDIGVLGQLASGARYLITGGGPGASNAAEAGGFVQSRLSQEGRPDVQLHFVPAQLDDHGRNKLDGHGFTMHASMLRPKSRGEIRLRSSNPNAHPQIIPNYLREHQDLAVMIEALTISREILNQPAFDVYRGACVFPAAESKNADTLTEYIRQKAETIYHPVGTCRMGSDDGAVVDCHLSVNGVDGLTVADASVMPRLVSGNTNAPTIMIGERAADCLLRRLHG